MLKTSENVLERAKILSAKKKPLVAVAGAEDGDVLQALTDAHRLGIVGAILVGNAAKIRERLGEFDLPKDAFEIVDANGVKECVTRAVELCSAGRAQILMKGKVPTGDLMKALLNPKAGLRQGKLLSHCAVLEIEGQKKLISLTDGGVVTAPDFQQKVNLVENAVRVNHYLGITEPKVAILGLMNEPDPEFPTTIEAAAVARACYLRGLTPYVEGPLTLDAALMGKPEWKGKSVVAGDADIVVFNNIEEANICVKAITNLRTATFMGVIMGAKVPLSLVSRADTPRNKLMSLALASVIAGEEQ